MDLLNIIRVAFRALQRNKMRAALTMLGIIIGVSAVVAMVSIGQGAQATVQAQIDSIGTNLLFVTAGAQNGGGGVMTSKAHDRQGCDQDDTAFTPYTTVQKKILGSPRLQIASVSPVAPDATYTAQQQISELLRQRQKLGPNEPDDCTVRNMS